MNDCTHAHTHTNAEWRRISLELVADAGLWWPVQVERATYETLVTWTGEDEAQQLYRWGTDEPTDEEESTRARTLLRVVAAAVQREAEGIGSGRIVRAVVSALPKRGARWRSEVDIWLTEGDQDTYLSVRAATVGTRARTPRWSK